MRKRICLYLLLMAVVIHGQGLAAEPRYDFRVVIDVSGSMKKNRSAEFARAGVEADQWTDTNRIQGRGLDLWAVCRYGREMGQGKRRLAQGC